ncbi:MAG: DUF86 domain-containing protein [Anaerolineae bacterium]|nr:DUF86 domain-containing protein [Anaerolineae bacterium]
MERLITEKLSRLKEYLGYLETMKDISLESFLGDFKARGAAERYLQLAIESVIDIGNEIISSLQLRRPERYREIPHILAEAKIIPNEFADRIAQMIGFRNLLVHDYAIINKALEHEFLKTRLPDFKSFMKHIVDWLKEKQFSID